MTPSAINISPHELLVRTPGEQVFKTQHSTDEHFNIACNGLVYLCEIGSTMHGVSDPFTGDDVDEMGVCIEPPEEVIGLPLPDEEWGPQQFEQYEYRTQPVNVRSGPGDIDRVIYSLRKYAALAAAGNPTVLMPLFADPEKHVRYFNSVGESLRANRDMFLSKQCGRKFLGYLQDQRDRYLNPERQDSKHASRPELIEAYGWDCKTGYHVLRLAIQGAQLMGRGTIDLPMSDFHRTYLLGVRRGEYTKEEVTTALDEIFIPQLKERMEESTLPDKPDMERINNWLVDTYLNWWEMV